VLLHLQGVPSIDKVRVGSERLVVGREPSCDLIVPDPTVSRRHVGLAFRAGELVVTDLGSSGGTFVNGARIEEGTLEVGDRLRLGPRVEYLVEVDGASSALGKAAGSGTADAVRSLQTLLEAARALNATTVLSDVMDVVLRSAVELAKADQGCVALVDERGVRHVTNVFPHDLKERLWGEESSLLQRAIAERRTVTAEVNTDPLMSAIQRGFASAVATPLLVARRPMGALQEASFAASVEVLGGILVERRAAERSFTEQELAVFETLAADAAVALDGARLYRESRERARIAHEMELARAIQVALLQAPAESAFADLYAVSQAARTVGGDLYHCCVRGDGRLGLAVGDVSGKGVAAALIMAMAQGILSVLHDLDTPPVRIAEVLNRTMLRYNPGNRFLTLAVVLLGSDGEVELLNAGHCPVAVLRADGSTELVSPGGPVVGILPEATWRSGGVSLARGEALVLYSDGILESFSPEGAMFGEEGLKAALGKARGGAAREIGERLLAAALDYRQGREAEDDVTLLVARFLG
jgi:sigma-B regulation protein RsbU (phosphoserine phosphatase)